MVEPGAAAGDVSADGTLVYVSDAFGSRGQLVRVGRSGEVLARLGEPGRRLGAPALSPDKSRVALRVEERQNVDVWILDLESGARSRLTSSPDGEGFPAWFPDGRSIAFRRTIQGDWAAPQNGIWVADLVSATSPRRIVLGKTYDPLPDGSGLVFETFELRNTGDLSVIGLEEGATPAPILATEARTEFPAVSPDGESVLAVESLPPEDSRLVLVEGWRPEFQGER